MPNTRLYIGKDDKGIVTNEIPWPSLDQSYHRVLNNGVEEVLNVPVWASRVLFVIQPGAYIICGYGNTPLTLPTDLSWKLLEAEGNPILRPLVDPNNNPIDILRFISYTDNSAINVIFYAKNYADNT